MSEFEFDLETFLPFRIHQASEAVSQSFRAVYRAEYNMTRSQWRVLAHLGQYGAMTATEISESAGLHKTKVSRAVRDLEQRRWLNRQADQRDRRVQILQLTSQGKSAYQRLGKLARIYNRQLAQKMGQSDFDAALALTRTLHRAVGGSSSGSGRD